MKLLNKLVVLVFLASATGGLASTETPVPKTTYGSWDSITASPVPKGSTLTVTGWAADTAAKPTATSGVVVKVLVDGALSSQIPVRIDRPDVADFYGFKNSGFIATINTSTLTAGDHIVTIQVGGGPSGWIHYDKPLSGKGTITVTESNFALPAN